jgi:DNA-directed RNA polymerase subunit RPC12/RpoP
MHWECSACGASVAGSDAPTHCDECGTAGKIFVSMEVNDPMVGDPEADSLRAVWIRSGLERDRTALRSLQFARA